uniref:DUF1754-domain-containing protein n=1 Tax=Entomoneis paludosa TaxID=265537 RepID=A0A7S3DWM0_9STRA|mmetsp:Transcript_5748/g.12136  ORF Transcript_5748/g.12136 Transcript_5748/m.12136 type:complete len:111 (+) Transcript_5748:82-414(+)|eukprot:CAMPEP_0172445866 /NCGR_PEP_ID=MMETSP1065-20121228/5649_1 /TAXON_ID=265537 /ORGANISM="Amphiprora paludosa, Strain CCMP125" /LENGTH=110 /DNA_ID=CAMNT_0013196879 /DNA_START=86 /DNA_END=418 /DNA_ORIENTATION=+
MTGGFTGGALSFKGQKKAKKKKSKSSKHKVGQKDGETQQQREASNTSSQPQDEMTEAERKAMIRKKDRERKDLEKLSQKSHRETIEEFNERLANLTEHNDIPRVSAAGNG